jgi:uncharacterized membrane protein YphA (DoxX/SURF4 family)
MLIRMLFALPLILHGIGHLSGIAGAWSSASSGFSARPWIFSQGIVLQSPVGRAWSLLWLVAGLGLVAAGLGLLFGQPWWPALAVAGAVVSLVAMVPWWNAIPAGAKAGIVFDLVILVVLLVPPLREWLLAVVSPQ